MTAPPDITRLRAKVGEPITVRKWNDLLGFVNRLLSQFRQMNGRGLHVDEQAEGFSLWAEEASVSFTGAFYVTVGGGEIRVAPGTVNGDVVPALAGRPLDGSDNPGRGVPVLKVRGLTPNEAMKSWVVLEVTLGAGETVLTPEVGRAEIKHADDLGARPAGVGWLPLAMLEWADARAVKRVWQVVYFNQRHHFVMKGGRGVHYFHAAS
jgi:hypothetical protein